MKIILPFTSFLSFVLVFFMPLGFWPTAIASTMTTIMAGSQQMGDCTSVHAVFIPLQFWKYS